MFYKKHLLFFIAFASFSAHASEDMIKISGTACEIFDSGQKISSVRVRVTDKASYNAVSQIPSLIELRPNMLEHDFNVLVYDIVDNRVQNMEVKTTSQDSNEICVAVAGEVPSQDIVTIIANNSPSQAAKEYNFSKENGITQEENTPYEEPVPSKAEIMYDGEKDFDKIEEPTTAPIAYQDTSAAPNLIENDISPTIKIDQEADTATLKALVYIGPVEFSNNTHSYKPISVLKSFFKNEDVYTILDSPDGADYIITPKVLKAKIDPIDQQNSRLQMVVSTELKINNTDGSISDHQNHFVLFTKDQDEQEVAMNLLKKLLQKSGKKLAQRIEQHENKIYRGSFLRPKSTDDL
ncbi:MAG: hypothetical protein J6Y53_04200 [Alphaproteobacteria bacterium]|nr:hypothetical protein [Alphaproteobacteria bacterium]